MPFMDVDPECGTGTGDGAHEGAPGQIQPVVPGAVRWQIYFRWDGIAGVCAIPAGREREYAGAMPKTVRLFVKPGCPWCDEATEWLDARGIQYEVLDVIRNADARGEMLALTGQGRAPSIDVDGHILADFGADELAAWWKQMEF